MKGKRPKILKLMGNERIVGNCQTTTNHPNPQLPLELLLGK
jgi:hypothetical protein